MFGGAKDICPDFPQTCLKRCCATFDYKFSLTKIMKNFFWCDFQEKSSLVFLQTLGAIF